MSKWFVTGTLALCTLLFTAVYTAHGEDLMITDGKTVDFDYTLTVDGEKIDSSEGAKPLTYVQGEHKIVPGLEKQMAGLKVGDKKTIVVSAEEGYGAVDPEAFQEVPKENLPKDIELKVGTTLAARLPNGGSMPVAIAEVKDTTVVMNFNHPLAGKELHFDITVVKIS